MLQIDFDTAIPGHGRVMTRDDVRAYRARFAELNTRMRDLARRGVPKTAIATLAQARAQLKLSDLGWDNTVSTTAWLRNIGAHYDELAVEPRRGGP
jgi:hypothetical protein